MITWTPLAVSSLAGSNIGAKIIVWLRTGGERCFELREWSGKVGASWGGYNLADARWETYYTADLVSIGAHFSAINRPREHGVAAPSPAVVNYPVEMPTVPAYPEMIEPKVVKP